MFHRLTVPTYSGGLPAGYDYINTPSDPSVGGSGTPSFADGKKVGGPNDGTYLIAFGEDATSSFANRGMKALAENTDILDNILRKDIALTARTADVTAGSPVSSFVLTGQIFVGESGVTNNQATRDLLISVLDNNDNEIITSGGTKVVASLIHNGSSTNVVGTQASGFYNTPTVNLNVAIPTGVTYRVYYGERGNLATLPKDAFTNIKIRGAQEVSGEVERVLRDLHSTVPPVNWNDAFVASVNSLARTGLDGRYRLTTTDPGTGPTLDTPGAGGSITRDGPAMKFLLPTYLLNAFGTVGVEAYPDPLLAAIRLARSTPTITTAYDTTRGGDVGIVQESPYHTTSDANEVAYGHVTGPLLLDMIPRNITASTLSSNAAMTRIGSNNVALVNPDALTGATDRRTIQVNASDFVRDGSGRTALRATDLIEVTNNINGQVVGTFRVDTIISASRFTVKALTGANPPLGPSGSSASVKLRWLQPTISIGGRHRTATGSSYGTPHLLVASPGPLTVGYDAERPFAPNALFLSAFWPRNLGITQTDLYQAMAWGGFDTTGQFAVRGELQGDGGILTVGGRQTINLKGSNPSVFSVPDGGRTVNFDPYAGGHVELSTTALTGASPIIFVVSTANGYSETVADEFDVTLVIAANAVGPLSVTWPVNFKFSGEDGVVPASNPTANPIIVRYRFTFTGLGLNIWLAERWDY